MNGVTLEHGHSNDGTAPVGQNKIHINLITHSHGKGDEASQWRNPKFDPPPRPNPVIDRNTNRHT